MEKTRFWLGALLFAGAGCSLDEGGGSRLDLSCSQARPEGFPDLMIGTGGDGHTHPGATRPFGLVQVSPSNGVHGRWSHCSGYHFDSTTFSGLTHTALSGTGLGDFGDLLLKPVCGKSPADWPLDHEQECAEPGYYGLRLTPRCAVEATATKRAGYTRIKCDGLKPCGVKLDARWGQNSKTTGASLGARVGAVVRVTGWRTSEGFGRRKAGKPRARRSIYFACNAATVDGSVVRIQREKALITLEAYSDMVVICALSATSIEGAAANLHAQGGRRFDDVVRQAKAEWNRLLYQDFTMRGPIVGVSESVLRTALYHTLVVPNLISDVRAPVVNRRKFYNSSSSPERDVYYSTLSTWDTFRGAQPWLTLFRPDVAADVAGSMIDWARANSRRLPKWLLWTSETDVMVGYHSVAILADALMKDLVTDVEGALDAIEGTTSDDANQEPGVRLHSQHKKIPSTFPEAVSTGLEIAVDDACAARVFRRDFRRATDSIRMEQRAAMYAAYFDRATEFFRGSFDDNFDPYEFHYARRPTAHDFTEGSAIQYLFMPGLVDPGGLSRLLGGNDQFKKRLDSLFDLSHSRTQAGARDLTGCIGQYCHGNEVVHHVPYLYNSLGMPWLTQARINQVLVEERLYREGPDGLPGNDDCGQISAWLVLSALGFYSRDPCSATWELGRPLVSAANLTLRSNQRQLNPPVLRIVAHNQAPENKYVETVKVDGIPIRQRTYLTHEELKRGPLLEFFMTSQPQSFMVAAV